MELINLNGNSFYSPGLSCGKDRSRQWQLCNDLVILNKSLIFPNDFTSNLSFNPDDPQDGG